MSIRYNSNRNAGRKERFLLALWVQKVQQSERQFLELLTLQPAERPSNSVLKVGGPYLRACWEQRLLRKLRMVCLCAWRIERWCTWVEALNAALHKVWRARQLLSHELFPFQEFDLLFIILTPYETWKWAEVNERRHCISSLRVGNQSRSRVLWPFHRFICDTPSLGFSCTLDSVLLSLR